MSAFLDACRNGNRGIVKAELALSSPPPLALHAAAQGGSTAVVRLLLQHGANPRECDSRGRTPLHQLFVGGKPSVSVARLLLEAGADPFQPDEEGVSPYAEATLYSAYRVRTAMEKGRREQRRPFGRLPAARPWVMRRPVRLHWGELWRWAPVAAMLALLAFFLAHPPRPQPRPVSAVESAAQWPVHFKTARENFARKKYRDAAIYAQAALDCDHSHDAQKKEVRKLAVEAYLQCGQPEKAWPIATRGAMARVRASGLRKIDRLVAEGRQALAVGDSGRAIRRADEAQAVADAMGLNPGSPASLLADVTGHQHRVNASALAHRRELAERREQQWLEEQQEESRRFGYSQPVETYPPPPVDPHLPQSSVPQARRPGDDSDRPGPSDYAAPRPAVGAGGYPVAPGRRDSDFRPFSDRPNPSVGAGGYPVAQPRPDFRSSDWGPRPNLSR